MRRVGGIGGLPRAEEMEREEIERDEIEKSMCGEKGD